MILSMLAMLRSHLRAPPEHLRVLHAAIKNWPRTDLEKKRPLDSPIAAFVTSDFDQGDFVTDVADVATILSTEEFDDGKVVIFDGVDEYSYRAVLVDEGSSGWRVRSIKFQCPGCFGDGVIDGLPCILCEGLGWGAGR